MILTKSTELTETELTETELTETELTETELTETKLTETELTELELAETELTEKSEKGTNGLNCERVDILYSLMQSDGNTLKIATF